MEHLDHRACECRVRGQVSHFRSVALATVGGGTYELVTPHGGRSVFDEHLEQHGEGSTIPVSSIKSEGGSRSQAELRRQGREAIVETSGGEMFRVWYFRFPEIGSFVEVLYLDAAQMPAPEATIQPSS